MRVFKKIIDVLSSILCIFLVTGIIGVGVGFATGIRPYVVMSGSMEPTIPTGSVCFVNGKAPYEEVEVGDVIAFRAATGVVVTHRVIDETKDGFVTQGDANDVADGIVTNRSNFEGETVAHIPMVGYGIVALQKPANIAIVIVVILAILLLSFVDVVEDESTKKGRKKHSESEKDAE